MQIYFAAAMTNPDRDLDSLQRLVRAIEQLGHTVPTRHIAEAGGKEADRRLTDAELAQRDLDWIAGSDCLIAEVTTPSHGVGIEVMAARALRLPVLLLRRAGVPVSRLLLGLDGVEVAAYDRVEDACAGIAAFLGRRNATPA